MAQYAVIGLGRFGTTLGLQLVKMNHDVMGVDSDRKVVESLSSLLTHTVIADVTDENALLELGLTDYDAVIVAIGENLQASLLCVVHLKNLGIENLWVKATSASHHLILNRLGVTRIVHPEEEMGKRTAQALSYPMIREYMTLGNKQYIVEVPVVERLAGRVLVDLLADVKGKVFGILLKRRDQLYPCPHEQFVIEKDDILILAGDRLSLTKLAPQLI
ncbi:MAG: TrkA family potassium uptake protein [Methylicorpusculum sp.]|uniref:potassium channel family protein n=1 Tax=Methylicorpusculum sp. TaxID=2713644 RepID=UPI002722D932|nr:TrkA family potassium uptake protein [Methylicorpusculum sp.]MDO8940738.1 TrkA family potassium uptake protein [Methylicorpusculum sp.]MDO9239611.1 TrkA family potassium uptake protein [Methylicorpusculum sp.]MDP2204072.1 TrkA family potassium uptake protein [Methylicorpusculum sp.]